MPRERVALGDPSLTAGVPGSGLITLEQIDQWLADPKNAVELEPVLPLGLSQGAAQIDRAGLAKNPLTRAKIELGRQLYFDPRLSVDSTVSCASCHSPNGAGIPSQHPRIGGQHADYTESQLKSFASGARGNNAQMTAIAAKMNDRELKAVADYAAGLR
jgi:cytochrome c553